MNQKMLKEILRYEPKTGFFYPTKKRSGVRFGRPAGCKSTYLGYTLIGINGVRYYAHRLAWLYMNGSWPRGQIDHINCKRDDNRWSNIREASVSQNKCNKPVRSDNRLGIKGVMKLPYGSYRVRVKYEGEIVHDKVYSTIGEAKKAHAIACGKHHGEFARSQ